MVAKQKTIKTQIKSVEVILANGISFYRFQKTIKYVVTMYVYLCERKDNINTTVIANKHFEQS